MGEWREDTKQRKRERQRHWVAIAMLVLMLLVYCGMSIWTFWYAMQGPDR